MNKPPLYKTRLAVLTVLSAIAGWTISGALLEILDPSPAGKRLYIGVMLAFIVVLLLPSRRKP